MQIIWRWLPAILWMILIFLLSGRRSVSVSHEYVLNFLFFKSLHVIEYAVLFLLNARALGLTDAKTKKTNMRLAAVMTLVYAISDEIHQTFVPSREGKMRDVIIDAVGILLAWYSVTHILPKAPKKLRSLGKHWQLL